MPKRGFIPAAAKGTLVPDISIAEELGILLRPDSSRPLESHTPLQLFAMLLFGEARGQPNIAKIGVGFVVRNRVLDPKWWGSTWREIILKPKQFSCFNLGDPNRLIIMNPSQPEQKAWEECCLVAHSIYFSVPHLNLIDKTLGANHYHDTSVKPLWADPKKQTVQIDRFLFYKL